MEGNLFCRGAARRFVLCVLLAGSLLTGCSAREGTDVPASGAAAEPPSPAASVPAEESSSLPAQENTGAQGQEEMAPLQPGKIFALGDPQAPALSGSAAILAAEKELSRWQQLLSSGEVVRLDAMGMSENEGELSAESAGELLKILQEAKLSLYQTAGNPPTGGQVTVYAYGEDGSRLFTASYNGKWLLVQFLEEEGRYILNGEDQGLQRLQDFIE